LFNNLYNKLKEDKFEDLFQPASSEELEKRQKEKVDRVLKEGQCTLNPDGTYSCEGDVDFSDMGLTKLPVKFKEVGGSFSCSYNQLTSLEGSPEKVGGDFYCWQNRIVNLEFGPKEVGGIYNCSSNSKLHSLKGLPKKVGEYLKLDATPIGDKLNIVSIPGSELHNYV